ncbi:MAG: hypothetical protein HY868_19550 [Chloroflexi bacterium]|nr:hypothetical protein [Chloroflexota bacterium]
MVGEDSRVLRASEIGEYMFCHRAWWLHRVCGVASANRVQMQAGVARHVEHGRAVHRVGVLERASRLLVILAIVLAVAFALALLSPR